MASKYHKEHEFWDALEVLFRQKRPSESNAIKDAPKILLHQTDPITLIARNYWFEVGNPIVEGRDMRAELRKTYTYWDYNHTIYIRAPGSKVSLEAILAEITDSNSATYDLCSSEGHVIQDGFSPISIENTYSLISKHDPS